MMDSALVRDDNTEEAFELTTEKVIALLYQVRPNCFINGAWEAGGRFSMPLSQFETHVRQVEPELLAKRVQLSLHSRDAQFNIGQVDFEQPA